MRRAKLAFELCQLFNRSRTAVQSLLTVQAFVRAACTEAIAGDGIALFGHLRAAGELLPNTLDVLNTTHKPPSRADARVPNFLQMQLFVAMVATLEGMLSEMLSLVLLSFPGKIEATPSKDIVTARSIGEVHAALAESDLNKVFYAKPAEYRKRIETIISAAPAVLDPSWDQFTENKATRDVGLHNDWRANEIYTRKSGGLGRTPQGEGKHIYPDESYFRAACDNAIAMINALEAHCLATFKQCYPDLVFREMWRRSALQFVVPFEKAWTLYGNHLVTSAEGFSWGWSSTERLVFDFFNFVFQKGTPPDFVQIRNRWAGSETAMVVNEWLDAPFFL